MCGRFTLCTPGDALAELCDLAAPPKLEARYNIAPSQDVAAVRFDPDAGTRTLSLLRWGLVPAWSKKAPGSEARLINARAETVAERPAFRDAFRRRRCLLPADGFFEWKKEGRRKQPYLLRARDGRAFAFAGLWERWRGDEEKTIESSTILTTEPNSLVATLHDRMPVILDPKDFDVWLDPEVQLPERLAPLLRPFPAERMTAHPVGTRVNDPRNDDPTCIEPVPEPPSLF